MASQGTVPVYELVRGTTLPPLTIAFEINGSAPPFSSAQFSVIDGDNVLHTAACTLVDDEEAGVTLVTHPGASYCQTASWPIKTLEWSIRTTTDSGIVKEYVDGTYLVKRTKQPR